MTEQRKPTLRLIQLLSHSTSKTTKLGNPPIAASLLPRALLTVIRHVPLINDALVDVYPPQHMTYLLLYSVPHSGNAHLILIVNPFIHPQPSSNMRTKKDLTVNTVDEVEGMVGGAMLVVVEDGQHVSCLKVSLICCTCEEGHTTGSAGV
jgi:hypothetical protein